MLLKRVSVKNFRSIRDITIGVGRETAIVGGNGSGKSSLLRAIERFYGQSTQIDLDDFFGRETTSPIEISLTFSEFTKEEVELFKSRIHSDEMTVVRIFEAGSSKTNGRYYGETLQHPPFFDIRNTDGATPKRTAYNALKQGGGDYASLENVARADQIEPALAKWEADHPNLCERMRDDGQFLGFNNVARGALQKHTTLVFVPAVRDASEDAMDSRGAVIGRLLELVVKSAIQKRKDIRNFQIRVSEEFRQLTDPAQLHELGDLSSDLTGTLKMFYDEAAVSLKWRPTEDFQIPLPSADVLLDDDGFEGPVDKKGHGLQRAFILALLQHLAKATSASAAEASSSDIQQADEDLAEAPELTEAPDYTLPGLILLIEEPELYQHPTKQRHFARVLSDLSSGALPGVAMQTQVLFATHSSLFVSMDRFDDVCLAQRKRVDGARHKECQITRSSLLAIAGQLEIAYQHEPGTFTADGLKARLHIIDSELSEGFFADMVVLVEGVSDRAALYAAANLEGVNFESLGIAVLVADGKSKMDKSALIFRSLDIPTYVVWDCDKKGDAIEDLAQNRALQRIMGRTDDELFDAATHVGNEFACFKGTLETTLILEIGADEYALQIDVVKEVFSIKRKSDVEKTPFAMSALLKGAAENGKGSETLRSIIKAIVELRNARRASSATDSVENGEGAVTDAE